jgi:hypothetical protein
MIIYYKLENKQVVPVEDVIEWAEWFENANKRIKKTYIGHILISTVFLGVDYFYTNQGKDYFYTNQGKSNRPVVFETMIFWAENKELDQIESRACTWDEAVKVHREQVRVVIKAIRECEKNPPSDGPSDG